MKFSDDWGLFYRYNGHYGVLAKHLKMIQYSGSVRLTPWQKGSSLMVWWLFLQIMETQTRVHSRNVQNRWVFHVEEQRHFGIPIGCGKHFRMYWRNWNSNVQKSDTVFINLNRYEYSAWFFYFNFSSVSKILSGFHFFLRISAVCLIFWLSMRWYLV